MYPSRAIWSPRMVLTSIQLTWAHFSIVYIRLLHFQEYFTIDHLHVSYITPQSHLTPPTPPAGTLHPPDAPTPLQAPNAPPLPLQQYRHLVVKSGTTAGQHDMPSACGSGCCFVRCTSTPSWPSMPQWRCTWWPGVVLTYVQLMWAQTYLEFLRVPCKRLSSFFIWDPQCPPTPQQPLLTPIPPISTFSTGI